jgi:predicted nucleic acid-binding protein
MFLADTSIWTGRRDASRPELERRFLDRYAGGAIATCAFVALEVLRGPANRREYAADWSVVWQPLTWLPAGEEVGQRALEVQRLLVETGTGRHQQPALRFLVAACAELGGAVLWHAEPGLGAICAVTGQPQEAEYAFAPAGPRHA